MSSTLPNDLSLAVINDGAQIVASDHRNNYAAVQAAVNALRDALAGGTVGQVVSVVDATHIQLGLLTNSNVDAAAAISYSKLAAQTNHALLLAGSSTVGSLSTGTATQLLQSGGASADPAWASLGAIAAVAQTTPANPTGNSSLTAKMMGLSSGTTVITPRSSRVFAQITGIWNIASPGTSSVMHLRYGTGNGPANAAAVTGTIIGNTNGLLLDINAHLVPFTIQAIVTGLTPTTALWFDIDLTGDGTWTASVDNLTVAAYDLV